MKLLLNRLLQRGVWSYYSEADIDALVADAYIPVATHAELNQVRTAAAATFGAGTKWAGSYTGGLNKKYIQVRDIDLTAATRAGGAYDNAGAGWVPIGTFTGTYDGGGMSIIGMFINRTNSVGLFTMTNVGTIKNLFVDGQVTGNNFVAVIAGGILTGNITIDSCFASGTINATGTGLGGIVGWTDPVVGTPITISNCGSSVAITGTVSTNNRAGGIIGLLRPHNVTNCYSYGAISGTGTGGLVGASAGTVTASYYDTTTSGQSDNTGKGDPKTTAQMYALTAASTGWSVNDWIFGWGQRYPRLRAFKNTTI